MSVRIMRGPDLTGNKLRKGIKPSNSFEIGNKPWNFDKKTEFNCAYCGSDFKIANWVVKKNVSKSGRRFCKKSCHSKYKAEFESGENAPDYVGGALTFRGRSWLEQRAAAIERDGGKCQECGLYVGQSIAVHHIVPFRDYFDPDEANELSNLICLCQPCHMKIEPRGDDTD